MKQLLESHIIKITKIKQQSFYNFSMEMQCLIQKQEHNTKQPDAARGGRHIQHTWTCHGAE